MKKQWIRIALFGVVIAGAVAARLLIAEQYLDIHHLKEHREALLSLIHAHYFLSVLSFILLYIGTALVLPGALILTIGGGMMFGAFHTMLYANIGATAGAVLAFILARFLIGHWIQETFKEQLSRFNNEISRHGKNYMLVLRLLPVAPFFVINYCAGLTKIPLKTFAWTTSLGMIPGSFVYAFVGQQLRNVNEVGDVLSWKIILAFCLLALFALFPVVVHHLQARRK